MVNNPKSTTGGEVDLESQPFQVQSMIPAVGFDTDEADPPSMAYVGVNDKLLVQTVSNAGGGNLTVNVLMLRPDGQIIPMQFQLPTQAGFVQQSFTEQLMEGFILSVNASMSSSLANGNCVYVVISLVRQPFGAGNQYRTLCRGYVASSGGMSYPQDNLQRSTDSNGYVTSTLLSNPGAGADWTYTVPNLSRQRLVAVTATLTTGVAVANRLVNLIIDDGANVLANIPSQVTLAASLVNSYTFADSVDGLAAPFNGATMMATPSNCLLFGGWRVRSSTANIQAADQWSAITLHTIAWADRV
jgi:hypothetical protein